MTTKPNDPINHVTVSSWEEYKDGDLARKRLTKIDIGLTKREYLAAMAMQGIISNLDVRLAASEISRQAVMVANELIEALNKEQTNE